MSAELPVNGAFCYEDSIIISGLKRRIRELENRPHDQVLLHDMELMQRHIDKLEAKLKALAAPLK